jgi:hypothetical protein
MSPRFILVVVVCGAFASRVYGQTLADVAKKEEDRRKKVAAPAKVYTEKDLGTRPPPAPAPAETTAAKPPVDDKAAAITDKDAKDKASAKDQASWAARIKALQTQLDRDSTFADALQSKINALTTDFSARDDPAQRGAIERDRQKSIAEANRLKKAIVDDKKAIADLQEEARRAGVPPGWLR